MKNQVKSTLIQIIIGAAVVVGGLVALNKFVPNFTLFPDTAALSEKVADEAQSPDDLETSPPEKDESDLLSPIEKPASIFEADEEESSIRKNEIPKGVTANQSYSLDKRLRAGSQTMVRPVDVLKASKRSYTNSLVNEICPTNIKNYHKDFTLYFMIRDDKLVESILFLSVNIGKTNYAFKAQKGNNKLVIPNNLKAGQHQITFGYYLKKDVAEDKIPYYAKNCMITIK
jgi:hypothetical protein